MSGMHVVHGCALVLWSYGMAAYAVLLHDVKIWGPRKLLHVCTVALFSCCYTQKLSQSMRHLHFSLSSHRQWIQGGSSKRLIRLTPCSLCPCDMLDHPAITSLCRSLPGIGENTSPVFTSPLSQGNVLEGSRCLLFGCLRSGRWGK